MKMNNQTTASSLNTPYHATPLVLVANCTQHCLKRSNLKEHLRNEVVKLDPSVQQHERSSNLEIFLISDVDTMQTPGKRRPTLNLGMGG